MIAVVDHTRPSLPCASYGGCVYQCLLILKQFLRSYNKKFHGSILLNTVYVKMLNNMKALTLDDLDVLYSSLSLFYMVSAKSHPGR